MRPGAASLRSRCWPPARRRGGRPRLDRAALEHAPLAGVELVEAGGEQRPQARRHLDPGSRLGGHRQHLGDEERVAAGQRRSSRAAPPPEPFRSGWPRPRCRAAPAAAPLARRGGARAAPGGRCRRPAAARRWRAARLARPGRGMSAHPTECRASKRRTSGACSTSSLRNAQAISSADVPASDSPNSERIAAAAAGSEGVASSCFSTSTTGQ